MSTYKNILTLYEGTAGTASGIHPTLVLQQSERSTQWNGDIGDVMTKGQTRWKGVTKEKGKCSSISEDLSWQRKLHQGGISNQRSFPRGSQPSNVV